jgi:YebC/PmpR family DNA-binding regulatory protein
MSGHSKWSTIKRKKEVTDQARGKLFSKLSKAISIAIKTGGGSNPETNYKLKAAIEAAKSSNMPKVNIDRALKKAAEKGNFEEVIYEGFGPGGIFIIIETVTDNRNRTGQEIKGIFERGGGRLAGPGSVSYNFDSRGLVVIKKDNDIEEQMLKLIDDGVEDIEEVEDEIEVYTDPNELGSLQEKLKIKGYKVVSADLVLNPKTTQVIDNLKIASQAIKLLDNLSDHDDIQKVSSNIDVSVDIIDKIQK